jgi:hypothetical protein
VQLAVRVLLLVLAVAIVYVEVLQKPAARQAG